MRLIDADELKSNFFLYAPPEMRWDRGDIEHKIDEMPTIDAVSVVRCWECIYNTDDGYHECIEFGIRIPDDAEFFCKYGKRKGGGTQCG